MVYSEDKPLSEIMAVIIGRQKSPSRKYADFLMAVNMKCLTDAGFGRAMEVAIEMSCDIPIPSIETIEKNLVTDFTRPILVKYGILPERKKGRNKKS